MSTVHTAPDREFTPRRRLRVAAPMQMIPPVGLCAVAIAVAVDSTTRVGMGAISVSGAVSLGLMIAMLGLSPLTAGIRALPSLLSLFFVYAAVRLVLTPTTDGLQNVAVITMFCLGIGFAARDSNIETAGQVLRAFTWVAVMTSAVFLLSSVAGAPLYGTRSFALTALVLLAATVALPMTDPLSRFAPFIIVGAIVMSLSRTASVISVLVLVGLVVRMRRGARSIAAVAGALVAAGSIWILMTSFAPLRDRFLVGDNAASVGGMALNTSGRSALWAAMLDSAAERPLFGKGPGSSVAMITARFGRISQPHNDYLRVLHDYGWIGLVLFSLGCLVLVVRLVIRAAREDHPIHWAALISILAVLVAAATDNVIVYPFVMLPLAVLVGMSLGLSAPPPTRPTRCADGGRR